MSPAQLRRIRRMAKNGLSSAAIATVAGVPESQVRHLVECDGAGEAIDIEELVRHGENIKGFMFNQYPGFRDEVEKAITDAIMTVQEHPRRTGWVNLLITVARRRVIDQIRGAVGSRRKENPKIFEVDEDISDRGDSFAAVESSELASDLREKVAELPDDLPLVVYAYLDQNCSGEKAAKAINYNQMTFYRRLRDAMTILRGLMCPA